MFFLRLHKLWIWWRSRCVVMWSASTAAALWWKAITLPRRARRRGNCGCELSAISRPGKKLCRPTNLSPMYGYAMVCHTLGMFLFLNEFTTMDDGMVEKNPWNWKPLWRENVVHNYRSATRDGISNEVKLQNKAPEPTQDESGKPRVVCVKLQRSKHVDRDWIQTITAENHSCRDL